MRPPSTLAPADGRFEREIGERADAELVLAMETEDEEVGIERQRTDARRFEDEAVEETVARGLLDAPREVFVDGRGDRFGRGELGVRLFRIRCRRRPDGRGLCEVPLGGRLRSAGRERA